MSCHQEYLETSMEVGVKYNHSLKATHKIMRYSLWNLMSIWLMYQSMNKLYTGADTRITKSNSHIHAIRTNLSIQTTTIYQAFWIRPLSHLNYVNKS